MAVSGEAVVSGEVLVLEAVLGCQMAVLASASEFHLLLSQSSGIVRPAHFVSQGMSFCGPQVRHPTPKPSPGFCQAAPEFDITERLSQKPLTGGSEIFPRLHRHPIGTFSEHHRTGQRDHKLNESAVWVGEPACN